MRPVDYIALAIPVFFLLIGVEWLYARFKGERLHRLEDSVTDLSTGILDQVLGVFTKAITIGAYAWVWERWRVSDLDAADASTWILGFLGVDFLYYWFHRVSHESNLPWGAHIVHHSSEEYNLSVALRQGAFQSFFSFPFYLPLAWLGFPPVVFLACSSLDTLYQFWIHTRTIGRLGPLEWVLNTPSHHRVHHGCDAKYIDRNYAGTLIVWDRLFGSFQAEEEEPVYGITKPLASWNPVWANLHHYVDLLRAGRRAPSRLEAAKLWLKGPGWQPPWAEATLHAEPFRTPLRDGEAGKYARRAPQGLGGYALVQFLLAIAGALALLWGREAGPAQLRIALAALVAWTVLDVGLLLDGRGGVVRLELLRLGALLVVAALAAARTLAGPAFAAVAVGALAVTAAQAAWLLARRRALGAEDGAARIALDAAASGGGA